MRASKTLVSALIAAFLRDAPVDAQDALADPNSSSKSAERRSRVPAECGVRSIAKSKTPRTDLIPYEPRDDGSEISILAVYTKKAREAYGSTQAMVKAITKGVDDLNLALANSRISLKVKMVHCAEIGFLETSDSNDDLDRVANLKLNPSGGVLHDGDETAALRLHWKADVVVLVRHGGYLDGTAYMLQEPLDPAFDRQHGFLAVKSACVSSGYNCLAHEFGHLLGCAHDRSNIDVLGRFPNFSYGYAFDPPNDNPNVGFVGTMMSYSGANNRLFHFSNPSVSYAGSATGKPVKFPDGSVNPEAADNALTINLSKKHVANYMQNSP